MLIQRVRGKGIGVVPFRFVVDDGRGRLISRGYKGGSYEAFQSCRGDRYVR
jgi:hypothetical protein